MKNLPWLILITVVAVYAGLISVFEFSGPIALTIHFARTSVVMAVLIIFAPKLWRRIFTTSPAPPQDYLLGGIYLNQLSNESFSIWNEMGRVWGLDTSIFTNPVAGFFSLMLVVSGAAFLKASDLEEKEVWAYALVAAGLFSTLLVFVAPMFR